MSQKQVSIIIPCFNREKLITESLNSVLQQSYPNWECIVVDDGSTDATVESIEKFSDTDGRFRLVHRNREPKGAPTCRNIGISKIRGDYFMFLDSDDILDKNCLTNRVLSARSTSEYDAWAYPSQYFQNKILLNKLFFYEDSISNKALAFLLRPQWPINGSFFNTVKFRSKQTLFNENMPFWQDWEFHINCLLNGIRFCQFGNLNADTYIRSHENSNRINNREEFDPKKMNSLYFSLFSIHSQLRTQNNLVDSFFQYRLLYLFEYLILRGGSSLLSPGLNYLEKLQVDLKPQYKLLNYVSQHSPNSRNWNKILSYMYSLANNNMLKLNLSKLHK